MKPLYQVVRFDPKGFRQRRPKGNGGWGYSVKGTRLVPYRLPDLVAAPSSVAVFVVEGEKDADRAAGMGIIATTFAMVRASGGPSTTSTSAADRRHRSRQRQARRTCAASGASLHGIAKNIKVVELPGVPEKGDLSDWLDQGHTKAELGELVKAAPEWKPAAADNQPPPFVRLLTGAELLALDLKPRFLVRGVMVEGQPMIVGGRCKTLKTSLLATWPSVSAAAHRFLAGLMHSGWSWDSGPANPARRRSAKRPSGLPRVRALTWPTCDVSWCFDLPRLSQLDHLDHLAATIRQRRLKVAILDPLYLALLVPGNGQRGQQPVPDGVAAPRVDEAGAGHGMHRGLAPPLPQGWAGRRREPGRLGGIGPDRRCRVGPAMDLLQRRARISGRRAT